MATQVNHQEPADTELIGSRIGRIDPDIFQIEHDSTDDEELNDEPADEDDQQRDDNYALGGDATRSGGL